MHCDASVNIPVNMNKWWHIGLGSRLAVELQLPQHVYNTLKTASSDEFVSLRCEAKEWRRFRHDIFDI